MLPIQEPHLGNHSLGQWFLPGGCTLEWAEQLFWGPDTQEGGWKLDLNFKLT